MPCSEHDGIRPAGPVACDCIACWDDWCTERPDASIRAWQLKAILDCLKDILWSHRDATISVQATVKETVDCIGIIAHGLGLEVPEPTVLAGGASDA